MVTRLFPYQEEGIQHLEEFNGRALVSWEMGCGKTLLSLYHLLCHPEIERALVICPASAKWHWQYEASRHVNIRAEILSSQKPARRSSLLKRCRLLIINYDVLAWWQKWLIGDPERPGDKGYDPQLVIMDESHYCQSPSSKRTKACKAVCKGRERVLALSGTPLINRPKDLWSILHIVRPDLYPNWYPYAMRFCSPKKKPWGWDFNGASHLEELHENLVKHLMIRKRKVDVLKDLPAKMLNIVPLPTDNMDEYKEARDDYLTWIKYTFPGLEAKVAKAEQVTKVGHLKRLAANGKLPYAIEWIENFLQETDEKLLVFGIHIKVLDQIQERFRKISTRVDGSIVGEDRQVRFNAFNNDKKIRLFIGNIDAAGVIWSCRSSSNVAFVEMPWSPGKVNQAIDRCLLEGNHIVCLPNENPNNGIELRKIEAIKKGDMVLSHMGKYQKVIGVHSREEYNPKISTIKYVGWHETLKCTHDHLILVKRNGALQWLPAQELLPSDAMAFPRPKEEVELKEVKIEDRWRCPSFFHKRQSKCLVCGSKVLARQLCSKHLQEWNREKKTLPSKVYQVSNRYKALPDTITIDDDWLFLFGWYVAEGCVKYPFDNGSGVHFSARKSTERQILERLADTVAKAGIKAKCSFQESKKDDGMSMKVHSTEMGRWFYEWFGKGSYDKHLPKELLTLPSRQTSILLGGYIAGDGCKHRQGKNKTSLCSRWISASKTLCWQMTYLAIKAGHIPTMQIEHPEYEHPHWAGSYTTYDLRPPIYKRLADQDENYIYRPIRSVTTEQKEGQIKLYDLTVENDHSFACGLSTVHNCHGVGRGVPGHPLRAWFLVAKGTMETSLCSLLQKKQEVADSVIDGNPQISDFNLFDKLNEAILQERKENESSRTPV